MRDVDSDTLAALQSRILVPRDFIWLTAKDRSTGDPETAGFWNDVGSITASVVDGETGGAVSRVFKGSGNLIAMDDLPLTSDISIRNFTATLSQVSADVAQMVRGYDLKGAPTQIHRGLLDPVTRLLVAPALPRFVGYVDSLVINTPPAALDGTPQFGSIVLTLASHTRELTRFNTDKRSDASQQLRQSGDRFFQYADTMGKRPIFWGVKAGSIS